LATQSKRDYYEVLGVSRTANDTEIKGAYRKLAMAYHPDRNPDNPEAEDKFKECSEAYSVLSDPQKRQRYDQFGHAGVGGPAAGGGFGGFETVDFSEIFGDMFGDFFGAATGSGGRRRSRAQRGADLRSDLTLQFEEAVFGVQKSVTFRRREVCEQCNGTGASGGKAPATCRQCHGRGQVRYQQGFFSISRACPACQGMGTVVEDPCKRCRGEGVTAKEHTLTVDVPAGVEEGTRILFSGHGDSGVHGGPAGDVYVVLHVKDHAVFEREGKDLQCAVPITFSQAALGTEIKIPTLEGESTIKIPEGTQTGTIFRLRNKGVPVLNGHGRGDLYVEVKVQTPSKLNKRQRELIEELSATFSPDNKPEKRSLLSKVKDIFG
jgi:molecular chaperone DnaJ